MKNSKLAAKSSNPEKFLRVIELLREHLKNMSTESAYETISNPSDWAFHKPDPEWTNKTKKWYWDTEDGEKFYTLALGSGSGHSCAVWAYLGFSHYSIDLEDQYCFHISDEVQSALAFRTTAQKYELEANKPGLRTGKNFLFFIFQETDHHFTDRSASLCIDLSSEQTPEDFLKQIIDGGYINPQVDKRSLIEKQIEDLQKELKNME